MNRPVHGLRAWVVQRISAVYLAIFTVYMVLHFTLTPPASYDEWRSWVASPGASVGLTLFFVLLLAHAWVGTRDIIMDYIHPLPLRAGLLMLLGFALLACSIWVGRILLLAAIA